MKGKGMRRVIVDFDSRANLRQVAALYHIVVGAARAWSGVTNLNVVVTTQDDESEFADAVAIMAGEKE